MGCLAQFVVKQLQLYPHIGEIIHYHSEHTKENDEVAHRVMDPNSIARRSEIALRISKELKGWLIKRLDDGLVAKQVFGEHKNVWYEDWTKIRKHSKDNSLLRKYVRYHEYQREKNIWLNTKMHW